MNFIPASELKKKYDVYGQFYSVVFPCGSKVECRSVLEILNKKVTPSDINTLHGLKPDCIFIMMNPGSSSPKVEVNNTILSVKIKNLKISYVLTKPDTTQYQVMRVMHAKEWNHVRVLNLSDLRNPKSGEFISKFNEVEGFKHGHIHSLFSEFRREELALKMNRKKGAPVVCAWGVSDKLDPLIRKCIEQVGCKCKFTGIMKVGTSDKYYHPLPTLQKDKVKWVKEINKLLS